MTRLYLDMRLGRFVTGATKTPAREKQPASEIRANGSAMAKAKRLAAKHGIEIERDRQGGYWVTHPELTDKPGDPLDGGHFCSDGQEALEAVTQYADHLTGSQP